ncbi:hypothetical protein IFM89_018663 [Coptis chinensis]|uniref:CSC1-like protein n=1 Tax=Coptis chinensis TaxID=261450 RepID=A0A835I3A3_9MAGN|nr:hypothetical protein IFM89_018663 [Coptis chinensis]
MIVSALLTSVGINLFLCILFFTLYSILRKQPGNIDVYAPRLIANDKSQTASGFNLERLLPSTGWVRRAWDLSEDELLSISGLDGVVFMRIFTFSLKMFSFIGLVGVFILLPINYVGGQLRIDIYDLPNKSLDLFSISNVENGSKRLWVHFGAVYITTAFVCYLLYQTDAKKLYKRLTHLKSDVHAQQKFRRSGFLGLFGPKVSLVDHYGKKLDDLEENVRVQQSDVSLTRSWLLWLTGCLKMANPLQSKLLERGTIMCIEWILRLIRGGASCICILQNRYGASIALNIQQSIDPTEWIIEQAPEPHDVYWPFFFRRVLQRWISKLAVIVASIILTLLFLLPVVFVQVAVPGQLINVYEPKFDTGGKFWPIVHNSTIFSLLLVQAIAVGIFGLKKLPLASSMSVPLLILTLLFNEYCRKRFFPIFRAYSAEVLPLPATSTEYFSCFFRH